MQQYSLGAFPESGSRATLGSKNNNHSNEAAHQRSISVNSAASSHYSSPVFSSSNGMPGPPPPTPAMNMTFGFSPGGSICDDSSRSTSAYSNIPPSSLPLLHEQVGRVADYHAPSGSIKAILNTMNVSNANRTLFSNVQAANYDMPPPPLPQHALDAKENETGGRHALASLDPHATPQQPTFVDRRMESRSNESDVSMHAGCNSYPNCTFEDADGHIVHTPSTASQDHKGEMEDTKSKNLIIFGILLNGHSDGIRRRSGLHVDSSHPNYQRIEQHRSCRPFQPQGAVRVALI